MVTRMQPFPSFLNLNSYPGINIRTSKHMHLIRPRRTTPVIAAIPAAIGVPPDPPYKLLNDMNNFVKIGKLFCVESSGEDTPGSLDRDDLCCAGSRGGGHG